MREWFLKYKNAIILIFIVPMLVNLVSLFIMNGRQIDNIPMVVYMGDNTSFTRNIVNEFENNNTFDVKYYVYNPYDVEKYIDEGKALFGLVIPKNFTEDLKKFKSPTIMTVVDGSQLSSASFTKIKSSEILMTFKIGASNKILRAKLNISSNIINFSRPIAMNAHLVGNPTRDYVDFLLPGFMTALVQIAIAMIVSALAIGKEKSFKDLLNISFIYTTMGFISMMEIIMVQSIFFNVGLNMEFGKIIFVTLLFSMAVTNMSMFIASIVSNKVFASQVAAVWFIPSSILSGYTWPTFSMPKFYQYLSSLMPYTHYGKSLRDLMLLGKSYSYRVDIIYLIIFSVVSLGLTNLTFSILKKDENIEDESLVSN